MTDQKRVVVLENTSYGSIAILKAPEDIVIVVQDFDIAEGLVNERGGNYMTAEEIAELRAENDPEWGIMVDEANPLRDGRFPVSHYMKHLLTERGQYRPSIPVSSYDSLRVEDKPGFDALYDEYAKPL